MLLYHVRFTTQHLTAEMLREVWADDEAVVQLTLKCLRAVHDVELEVAEWDYSTSGYSIISFNESDDELFRELIWAFERMYGTYDDRVQFDQDWTNDCYDPGSALHLPKSWFKVIGLVAPECVDS